MRVLLVTSEITFVPKNYDILVRGLVDVPEIYGLMVIRNRNFSNLLQGLAAIVSNAAPALGWQLIKNIFAPGNKARKRDYECQGKKFWLIDNINSPEVLEIIRRENIDLIINARTRSIFRESLLSAPRMGCVNIHHGLLPEQRGLMCDWWAHKENIACGFSLHEMTKKIDDGRLIRRVEVPRSPTSYLEYLERASLLECAMVRDFLKELRNRGSWSALESYIKVPFTYRKNPTVTDFYDFKKSGLSI